jgi:nondiscriminating glutamyl-tRNA synthetase
MEKVRVRFAPSPTGFVHVGSLRTALYNYLFARHNRGTFILRIEDTDRSRFVERSVENLLSTLKWSGLDYDEGPGKEGPFKPYYQSKRLNLYKKYAGQLLKDGNAYYCFCTEERLERMRQEQIAKKLQPKYDGKCRDIPHHQAKDLAKEKPYVIRMRIPLEGETIIHDLIRGDVSFQNASIDDQIICKADGFPTYHLANVVDDHLMQISHVIRGEEWLQSTPKHIILYNYFKWSVPQFAHLPLLLNPDRSKLSKRQGDVAVEDCQIKGYLPQALLNFVALLGWNKGDDQEIFSLEELIESFTLEKVNKSGAIFNKEKLDWINGIYIRNLPEEEYYSLAVKFIKDIDDGKRTDNEYQKMASAIRNSLVTLNDIKERAGIFFKERIERYSDEALEWIKKLESKEIYRLMINQLEKAIEIQSSVSTLENFKQVIGTVQKATGIKGKELWMPIRSAITGLTEGPDLPLVIEILGEEKVNRFLKQALDL